MADSYVVVGSLLAVLATAVLFLRPSKPKHDKVAEEMLRIGLQMKMYQAAAEPPAATSTSPVEATPAYPGGRVAILFGSQTGTAEGFAEVLKKEGREAGFEAHALDLESYDAARQLPDETLVILIMATYGEGDPTDNAVDFVTFLKDRQRALAPTALARVHYTVFGVGNTQYEHYNAVGRLTDKLMAHHGATRVFPYGEGDDDASVDEDFDDWKEALWKTLRQQFLAVDERDAEGVHGANLAPPEYEVDVVAIDRPEVGTLGPPSKVKASTKHFFTAKAAKVVVKRELRQSIATGSTVHLEVDLRTTGLTYNTADNLAVLPENDAHVVALLAKRLHVELAQWVALQPVAENLAYEYPFPSPCTIQDLLTRYLAINSAPRKGPLKQLAFFATDATERAALTHLASKDGKDAYQKWIVDAERSFVDVLVHFSSVHLSVQDLVHLVPFLLPRYYTISSSSLVHPHRVHVTVSVIERTKPDCRVFRGVCSNYLSRLQPLDRQHDGKKKRASRPGEQGEKHPREWPAARIFIRPSTFRLPRDPQTPIILIGPGTGIAPMRAFLQERLYQSEAGVAVGQAILYFGCRRRDADYLYQEELAHFQARGVLSELHVAFSRAQRDKVYVQHLLLEQGETTWALLRDHDAHVYVCGATTMGNDVHKVLQQVIETHGARTPAQAAAVLKQLQDDHRYVQELWA